MTSPLELEKHLKTDVLIAYSKTYFLMLDEILTMQRVPLWVHYSKVNALRESTTVLSFAELVHGWAVEFQVAHIGIKWNGDYIAAVNDFVDEKLKLL